MTRCIARRITVLASLKMRLEHGVYDVDVVQRVNHVSEACLPWPDNLFVGHVPQHGEDEIVGPGFVAGQHSDGFVSGGQRVLPPNEFYNEHTGPIKNLSFYQKHGGT